MGLGDVMSSLATRFDGWANNNTGLGTRRDKRSFSYYFDDPILPRQTLDALYSGSDIARTIVNKVVEEALRRGFTVEIEGDKQAETDVKQWLQRMDFRQTLLDAATWARLYGGAGILVGADNGDPAKPLDEENPGRIRWIRACDAGELVIDRHYDDPLGPNHGKPEMYRVTPVDTLQPATAFPLIHETRVVEFPGAPTTKRKKRQNKGWDLSVLQACWEPMQAFAETWQAVNHLVSDASQAVHKIKGLNNMIAAGQREALRTRMEITDSMRSVARSIAIDAEDDFGRQATPLSGLPEVLIQSANRLAAAAPMPVTILMGQAPAGLNATGDSDIRSWYATVDSYRDNELRPRVERILRLIFLSIDGPTGGRIPAKWALKFPSLYEPTDAERAAERKTVAETDQIYINAQVVTPEEVALSRWGGGQYSTEMQVDLELRRKMAEATAEQALKLAEQGEQEPDDDGADDAMGEGADAGVGEGRDPAEGDMGPPQAPPPNPQRRGAVG